MAWYPADELSEICKHLESGTWLDNKRPPSSYVLHISLEADFECITTTTRPSGEVLYDRGKVIKLQRSRAGRVRMVWGVREAKFEAVVCKDCIIWRPIGSFKGSGYTWRMKPEMPLERQSATGLALPGPFPPAPGLHIPILLDMPLEMRTLELPETVFASLRSDDEFVQGVLAAWSDKIKSFGIVMTLDGLWHEISIRDMRRAVPPPPPRD